MREVLVIRGLKNKMKETKLLCCWFCKVVFVQPLQYFKYYYVYSRNSRVFFCPILFSVFALSPITMKVDNCYRTVFLASVLIHEADHSYGR